MAGKENRESRAARSFLASLFSFLISGARVSRNWFAGWRGFVVATGLAVLALFFVNFFLDTKTPFLPCIAAVLMAGWLAGPKPALLCAAIVVSATAYSFAQIP